MLAEAGRDRRLAPGVEEDPAHSTPTTARCSRRRISTSSSSPRPITGTPCR
jgi:hypothetical protein